MNRRTFMMWIGHTAAGAIAAGLPSQSSIGAVKNDPWPAYLTFDGGFSVKENLTGPTIDALEALKDLATPATFFPNGRNLNAWEGPVLARIMLEGHALGNRLWQESGNTAADQSAPTLLAAQYFKAEKKIRQLLQSTNQAAAALYLKQARLYRRPGGDTKLATFLDPTQFEALTREPYLKPYVDTIEWLKTVYDYSGWHVGLPKKAYSAYGLMRQITVGSKEGQGAAAFLCLADGKVRSKQLAEGLIIALRDSDPLTIDALPQIIVQLRARGAAFKTLPRPVDQPNAFTVGVEEPPAPAADGAACLR
jgi:peptidoglycan/xylan/chitin deacetylase (PgdA/CDA1 family)